MSKEREPSSPLSLFKSLGQPLEKPPQKVNGHDPHFEAQEYEEADFGEGSFEEMDEHPWMLSEEMDHTILMHRDAHFGGDFQTMLTYYHSNGMGVNPDLEVDRIAYLAEVERELGADIAPLLLTATEAEKVAQSRQLYRSLKEIYEKSEDIHSHPQLIANLILTEEEDPVAETEALISAGPRIVPYLIDMIQTDFLFDPLSPGYGSAPILAAYCLGKLGETQALLPLFEMLKREDLMDEDVVLYALYALGLPAEDFLIKVLKSRPVARDNEFAASALTLFAEHASVAYAALEQLRDPDVYHRTTLTSYLLCILAMINEPQARLDLLYLQESPSLPLTLRQEIKQITSNWVENLS